LAVFRPKNDVPDFAHNLVVRTSDLCPDDLVCSQTRGKLVNPDKRLGTLIATSASLRATTNLWLSSFNLFTGLFLVVVSEGSHGGACDEFADVSQEPLAIIMMAVRPQGESGVPETAQVANGLAICWAAKLGVIQDRFFKFSVSDLALGRGCGDSSRADESGCEKDFDRYHNSFIA
jgi:hypothetical protein